MNDWVDGATAAGGTAVGLDTPAHPTRDTTRKAATKCARIGTSICTAFASQVPAFAPVAGNRKVQRHGERAPPHLRNAPCGRTPSVPPAGVKRYVPFWLPT